MEDELEDARAVAQVDEHEPAVVAPAVHPAGHAHAVADARGVELARPGVAVGVRARRSHRPCVMWCITVSRSTTRCSPDSMSFSAVPRRRGWQRTGPAPIRLLELALQAAAAELELRGVAGAARVGGQPEGLARYSGLA